MPTTGDPAAAGPTTEPVALAVAGVDPAVDPIPGGGRSAREAEHRDHPLHAERDEAEKLAKGDKEKSAEDKKKERGASGTATYLYWVGGLIGATILGSLATHLILKIDHEFPVLNRIGCMFSSDPTVPKSAALIALVPRMRKDENGDDTARLVNALKRLVATQDDSEIAIVPLPCERPDTDEETKKLLQKFGGHAIIQGEVLRKNAWYDLQVFSISPSLSLAVRKYAATETFEFPVFTKAFGSQVADWLLDGVGEPERRIDGGGRVRVREVPRGLSFKKVANIAELPLLKETREICITRLALGYAALHAGKREVARTRLEFVASETCERERGLVTQANSYLGDIRAELGNEERTTDAKAAQNGLAVSHYAKAIDISDSANSSLSRAITVLRLSTLLSENPDLRNGAAIPKSLESELDSAAEAFRKHNYPLGLAASTGEAQKLRSRIMAQGGGTDRPNPLAAPGCEPYRDRGGRLHVARTCQSIPEKGTIKKGPIKKKKAKKRGAKSKGKH